ncbi:MAG: hypothetical protein ACSHYF_09710 [Verrucomicrobiaceae bacterium]
MKQVIFVAFLMIGVCVGQTFNESGGLVVMEMESTPSVRGQWQEESSLSGFTGSGYLRFLGNTFETGPADSPLEFNFKINQAGLYYLHLHCAKETHEGRTDVANDCYVRVEGDYTAGPGPHDGHGDNASLALLQADTKYFGGATNAWKWENGQDSSGGAGNLDPGGHQNKRVAVYDFKAGETYKLVVSGRSKFFRINRLVFRHSGTAASVAQDLSTPESGVLSGGVSYLYDARTDFPSIDGGDVPYYKDNGNGALAIAANVVANRTGFARASRTFEGVSGTYDVTITTMTEEDGESEYRLLVNGVQVATYTNPFVFDPPESPLDLQPNTHTWTGITIPGGATIAVESNADTNGEIPEEGGTAWARGRWSQIEFVNTDANSVVKPPAGRLAIVSDGNSPDPDDIGAKAVMFGILKGASMQDRLVHVSHSCDLDPFSNPGNQTIDAPNELRRQNKLHQLTGEGIGFFGPFPNLADYYNCRTEQQAAVDDLRDAINASSASDPLWIVEGGEPDVIGYALQAATASKRQFVHVISHHPANDNSGDFFTWQQILDFGVTEHQIGDQNVGLQVQISSGVWDWAENHVRPEIAWIWDQLKYAEQDGVVGFQANKFDCSDAGMVYWWLSGATNGGNKNSTPAEMQALLLKEEEVVPELMIGVDADASVKEDETVVEQDQPTTLLGAGGNNPWVDRASVYVFQLPDLGEVANPFVTSSLTFDFSAKQGTLKNNDLYGLGRRASAEVLGSDYYGQTSVVDASDATRLQSDILTNSTALGSVSTSGAGSTALRDYLNAQYDSGAGAGEFVFLRLNTSEPKSGIHRATLTMSEGSAASPVDTRPRISYTVGGTPVAEVPRVVAGWDQWGSNTAPEATVTGAGIVATAAASAATGSWGIADDNSSGRGASGDGTWGSFDGGGVAASAVSSGEGSNMTAFNGVTDAEITFSITNNASADWELKGFHMDVVAFRPNAPRTYELEVLGGDISHGVVVTSGEDEIRSLGGTFSGNNDDHDEVDVDLSGLADATLRSGESAVIRIRFSSGTGSGGGHHLFLDNVAFSGVTASVSEKQGWRLEHFGTDQNAGVAADSFDADGDGEVNLLEFATGQNPLVGSRAETPVGVSGGGLEFRYSRSKTALADGVNFLVEWSDSLLSDSWSGLGVFETLESENSEVENVVATLPMGEAGRRFVHLKVMP